MATAWVQFGACMLAIGLAGVQLIRCGDAIAARSGLSRHWIGLILVATVTSLPELVTGLSAVTTAMAPDVAVGDALGSCVVNLAFIAIVLLGGGSSLSIAGTRAHVMAAAFGILLLSVAGITIVLSMPAVGLAPRIGHVGWGSVALLALYLGAVRTLYRHAGRDEAAAAAAAIAPTMTLRRALIGYAVAAAAIVAAGIALPHVAVRLAVLMGWSGSFVGTFLVALATSVPELATTLGAIRLGAVEMALANLLGSNLFDLLILAIDDLAYVAGPVYAAVSPLHAVTAMVACLMSATVIVALRARPPAPPPLGMRTASLLLLALYLINSALHHQLGP